MVEQLEKKLSLYFTNARQPDIQMILLCHKPAQIDTMSRARACNNLFFIFLITHSLRIMVIHLIVIISSLKSVEVKCMVRYNVKH